MFTTLFTATLFASVAVNSALGALAVGTPKLAQCQPATLNWGDYEAGQIYTVLAVPANDPCADAIFDFGDVKSGQLNVASLAIPQDTQVIISVTNSKGEEAWSEPITVGKGQDSTCLRTTTSSTGTSGAAVAGSTPKSASTSNTGSGGSDSNATPSDGAPADIVGGAANAANPFSNAAISARQASAPLAALVGLVAAFTLL